MDNGYRHALVDVLEVLEDLEDMIQVGNEEAKEGPMDNFDLGFLEALDAVKQDIQVLMGFE